MILSQTHTHTDGIECGGIEYSITDITAGCACVCACVCVCVRFPNAVMSAVLIQLSETTLASARADPRTEPHSGPGHDSATPGPEPGRCFCGRLQSVSK